MANNKQAQTKAIMAKMKSPVKIELGQKAKDNFGYRIEDHKGNVLKKGGKDFK